MIGLGELYRCTEIAWESRRTTPRPSNAIHKAANAGNATAMANLGRLYCNGKGVTQDYEQASEWYQKCRSALKS
jgi:TPR repeat protein